MRGRGATPPDYRTAHISFLGAHRGGTDPDPGFLRSFVRPSVRPSVRISGVAFGLMFPEEFPLFGPFERPDLRAL